MTSLMKGHLLKSVQVATTWREAGAGGGEGWGGRVSMRERGQVLAGGMGEREGEGRRHHLEGSRDGRGAS